MSIQSNAPLSNVESNLSAGEIVAKFTGTPDGTKFLRDDGTLAAGGGSPAIADITDWPSGLTATELSYVNGVTSAIQTQVDAKLPLAGSASVTGALAWSATAAPTDYGVGRSSTPALALRGPSSGGIECLAGSTSVQAKIGTTGITFPSGQTNPGSAYGICRDTGENATVVVSASSAASYLSASGGALVMAYGASHATWPGMTYLNPKAVSLANSAQRTIAISATGRSGFVEIVDLTNHRVARYSINAGVPTKDSGHAQFVAGAPGAGEVGVELSSTTLRVNNNSGGALLIAINAMLAY